jgi:hypothetical protein
MIPVNQPGGFYEPGRWSLEFHGDSNGSFKKSSSSPHIPPDNTLTGANHIKRTSEDPQGEDECEANPPPIYLARTCPSPTKQQPCTPLRNRRNELSILDLVSYLQVATAVLKHGAAAHVAFVRRSGTRQLRYQLDL